MAGTIVYDGFYQLKTYSLQQGDHETQPCILRKNAVVVLPYDPDRREIALIEQFRIGCLNDKKHSPFILECVAGMIEENQTPEYTAQRELEEEAGITNAQITLMHEYYVTPTTSNEYVYLFFARVTHPICTGVFGLAEENEETYVHKMTYQQAEQLLKQKKIHNSATLLALYTFFSRKFD
jgi:ADP-ribose pyrophosphatase